MSYSGNPSDKCKNGSVNASGQFRTNGQGGLVQFQWVGYDGSGNVVYRSAVQVLRVNQGDYTAQNVVAPAWTSQGPGSEQLHFIAPGFPDGSVTGNKTFSCRP